MFYYVCWVGFAKSFSFEKRLPFSLQASYPPLDIRHSEGLPRAHSMVLQSTESQGSTQNSGDIMLSNSCLQLLSYESDSGHENVFVLLQRDRQPFLIQPYFTTPASLHLSSLFIFKPCNPVFWTNFINTQRAFLHSTHRVYEVSAMPHCLSRNKLRNRWMQAEEPSIYPRLLNAKFKTLPGDFWDSWSRKCPLRQISSDIPQS